MTEHGDFTCPDCGGPYRAYGFTPGMMFRCLNARTGERRCHNDKRIQPKDLTVRIYKCNRCRIKVKAKADEDRPRECPKTWTIGQAEHRCQGDLIFIKLQSR
jgi:DNA-directed RNA polymerase subunit RPC12/RpoP